MTRIILPALGALLALVSNVDAKSKKDQVQLYQFTSDNCLDGPKGSNIELERDRCVDIDARSVKAMLDPKRQKWVGDVNNNLVDCGLVVYESPGCKQQIESPKLLPGGLGACVTKDGPKQIRSARFYCAANIPVSET